MPNNIISGIAGATDENTALVFVEGVGMAVAKRRGMRRAVVAVARKLAIVMHRIWSDGTEFCWARNEVTA